MSEDSKGPDALSDQPPFSIRIVAAGGTSSSFVANMPALPQVGEVLQLEGQSPLIVVSRQWNFMSSGNQLQLNCSMIQS